MHLTLMSVFWGNSLFDYLKCLLLFVVLVLAVTLFRHFFLRRLHKKAKATPSPLDNVLVEGIRKYLIPLCYYGAFYLSIQFLVLNSTVTMIINIASLALVAILGADFFSSIVSFLLNKYWERKYSEANNTLVIK